MCRFNLILVEESIAESKAGSKAEEYLQSQEYIKIYDNLNGYRAYEKGSCNCGSFVGSLIAKKGRNYEEAISERKNEKLDRLYKIRALMNQPDYKEKKEAFIRKQDKISEELSVFFNAIGEYEEKRTNDIQEQYEGEELSNRMTELYEEVGKLLSSMEEQPKYRDKSEEYREYLEHNTVMNESVIYYLTETEERKAEAEEKTKAQEYKIRLADILGPEISKETDEPAQIEYMKDSMVINEVIDRAEKDTFQYNREEYHNYYELFRGLLNNVRSFLFSTIWSEPGEPRNIKNVSLKSVKIDDLAFLEFNETICITK